MNARTYLYLTITRMYGISCHIKASSMKTVLVASVKQWGGKKIKELDSV